MLTVTTQEVLIRNYEVRGFHENCGGEWISSGNGFSNSARRMTEHVCNRCKDRNMFDRVYPRIEQKTFPV